MAPLYDLKKSISTIIIVSDVVVHVAIHYLVFHQDNVGYS